MSNTKTDASGEPTRELQGQPGALALAPCSAVCPKCGSGDALRRFRRRGERWDADTISQDAGENAFLVCDRWETKAKRDCITHHCRCCQYEWETLPLDEPNDRGEPRH